MKEKRSLFNMIFGNKKQSISKAKFEMLNGYNATFSNYSQNIYDSNIARECIDTIATHSAKLVPKHIQSTITNKINGDINYLLNHQPNPIMTKFDFIYRLVSILYTNNNVFVYIAKNEKGMITGFYPVIASSYEMYEKEGIPLLEFRFINGRIYTLPYQELIHIRKFYNSNDIYGENNNALNNPIQTAMTAEDGIKNAIKLSNNIRGIVKYTNSMLKEKDIKKARDEFVQDFIEMGDGKGIAALDSKAEFKEINMNPITLNKDQLEQVNYNIYEYFRINPKIIRSDFSSDEWNSFYESVIEPIAIQLSDAFTTKIFNKNAVKDGHKIVFTANRMQYANLDSKTKFIKEAGALGLLKKDEAREIFDLSPIGGEEGEKLIQSLNMIDSKIANNYQGGE